MRDDYLDIGNIERHYHRAVAAFQDDDTISERNREMVQRFLRDGALGKTNPYRAKKRMGSGRQHSYLNYLRVLVRFLEKDLDAVTQEDMERFIEALDKDQIPSSRHTLNGQGVGPADAGFLSHSYRTHLKQGIKKFYKWLWGENKVFPPVVEWIEAYDEWPAIPALTASDVERMVDHATTIEQRAFIQSLFDGGFRLGELLNVRLHDVTAKALDPREPSRVCYLLRVRWSKTQPRPVALPMQATRKWLTLWLEQHPAKVTVRHDGTIDARDVGMQLFPMKGNRARCIMRNVGLRALGKRVYPHLLRHTSATYWCNRLPYFKFCKRFGWTLTSKMPQRYIDASGIDDLEAARTYQHEEAERFAEERAKARQEITSAVGVVDEEAT